MPKPEDLVFDPDKFSGRVRLFPLPNLVLFPHVLQPLHIFEARYKEMLEEAIEDDWLIALALLAPGWEADYEGRPALMPVACLGRVATYHRMDDGRYNLLLVGLKRVGIVRELPTTKSFRQAEVEIFEDVYAPATALDRPNLQRRLLETFKSVLPKLPEAQEQIDQLLSNEFSLGMLTDIVSYTIDLELADKEKLLRELDVDRRATMLLERLEVLAAQKSPRGGRSGPFPPEFSAN
jgi:Lon protease-like protein